MSRPRPSPRRDRKRWLQTFEHGEMPHVEGCQFQALHVGGCSNEIVAESDPVVAAAISAHHVASAARDDLSHRLHTKRCKQAPHFAPLDGPHTADQFRDRYHANCQGPSFRALTSQSRAAATPRKCAISTSESTRIMMCCATLGRGAPHGHQGNARASRGREAYRMNRRSL